MKRFVEGEDRKRGVLPGSDGVVAEATGRLGYHPAVPPKLHVYGYPNRIHSNHRLEPRFGDV
jgi:hypothetical protein